MKTAPSKRATPLLVLAAGGIVLSLALGLGLRSAPPQAAWSDDSAQAGAIKAPSATLELIAPTPSSRNSEAAVGQQGQEFVSWPAGLLRLVQGPQYSTRALDQNLRNFLDSLGTGQVESLRVHPVRESAGEFALRLASMRCLAQSLDLELVARAWNLSADPQATAGCRQEALRALAALDGAQQVQSMLDLMQATRESQERDRLRTGLASLRDPAALRLVLERALELPHQNFSLLCISAVGEAAQNMPSSAEALRGPLSQALDLRDSSPRLAEQAMALWTALEPQAARQQATQLLLDPKLPSALARSAWQALAGTEAGYALCQRWLQDPYLEQERCMDALEAILGGTRSQHAPAASVEEARLWLRARIQSPGALGRRALHALAELGEESDHLALEALAQRSQDPLARAAARGALLRARSDWER